MLFCCFWCNVETSCHKHFVVVSRRQPAPTLTTSDKCHNLRGRVVQQQRIDNTWPVAALTAHNEARYRLEIAISAYHTCSRRPWDGSHQNIAMPFGREKLEWCGYRMVKKF